MRNLLLILGLFFTIHLVEGQVVINEFSCSNYTLGVGGDNEDFIEFVSKIARSYLFFFISFANLYLRTALKSPCAKLDSIETDTSGILLNKDIDHEGEKTSS